MAKYLKKTKRAPTIKKVVKMLKHFPDLLISYMGSFFKNIITIKN